MDRRGRWRRLIVGYLVLVSSSLLTSGKLASKPASVRLARRANELATMSTSSCFYSAERVSHISLHLAVMAEVFMEEDRERMWCRRGQGTGRGFLGGDRVSYAYVAAV